MAIGMVARALARVARTGSSVLSIGAALLGVAADELELDEEAIADLEFAKAISECTLEHACESKGEGPCNGFPRPRIFTEPERKEMERNRQLEEMPEWMARGLAKQAEAAKRNGSA